MTRTRCESRLRGLVARRQRAVGLGNREGAGRRGQVHAAHVRHVLVACRLTMTGSGEGDESHAARAAGGE